MTLYKLVLLALNIGMISAYVPINRTMAHGTCPKYPIDDWIPLIPYTVYPYLFFYFPWMIWLYGSFYFYSLRGLEQLTLTTFFAVAIGYFCFIFFPTYTVCPYPKGRGFTYTLLQFIHNFDRQNNACPSMHVYMTTLLMFFSWGTSLILNTLILIIGTVIIISTVTTKRHYVADIGGGVVVGIISILGGIYVI